MHEEVSHSEIYRELGVLQGKMDSLIIQHARSENDRSTIFERLGRLESRMAQVVIIAVVLGLVMPVAVAWVLEQASASHEARIERSR